MVDPDDSFLRVPSCSDGGKRGQLKRSLLAPGPKFDLCHQFDFSMLHHSTFASPRYSQRKTSGSTVTGPCCLLAVLHQSDFALHTSPALSLLLSLLHTLSHSPSHPLCLLNRHGHHHETSGTLPRVRPVRCILRPSRVSRCRSLASSVLETQLVWGRIPLKLQKTRGRPRSQQHPLQAWVRRYRIRTVRLRRPLQELSRHERDPASHEDRGD